MKKNLKILALLLVALFCLQAVPAYAAGLTMRVKEALEEEEITEEEEEAIVEEEVPPPAEDGTPQYANTKAFISFLEELDIDGWEFVGVDGDGDEYIQFEDYAGDEYEYVVNMYFAEDNEQIGFYIWYVIEYEEEDFADVLYACNSLNYDYKFLTFYADETDNTVTASMNLIVRENDDVAEIAIEALLHIENILAEAIEVLDEYSV